MAESNVPVRRVRRDGVLVEGDDALSWLQGQVSQDLSAMADGESRLTLVLSPQGKVSSFARVTQLDPRRILLDLEAGYGAALMERLTRFKLRVKASLVPVEVSCEERAGGGLDAFGPPRLDTGCDVAESEPRTDDDVFEAARIRAMVPRLGRELTEATIPQEAGDELVSRTVSFTKGCYTGQELVARLDARGSNVPRRLRTLSGSGPLPAPGAAVLAEGGDVGTITSAAPEPGGFVAIGSFRRTFLQSGTLAVEVVTAEGTAPAVLAESGGA